MSIKTPLTEHAQERMMQRAVNDVVLDLILELGETYQDYGGATYVLLKNRHARKRIARKLKQAANKLERRDGLFAVEAEDGAIVTVGHAHSRHKHV